MDAVLNPYIAKWGLVTDGEPFSTRTSVFAPVRWNDLPAILKIALHDEERRGAAVMAYYGGGGAAQVLAFEGDALLLERASDAGRLIELTKRDHDDDATRIICATVARLHVPRAGHKPADLVPLNVWFRELERASAKYGGIFAKASVAANELLAQAAEPIVLHGDIHHRNILYDDMRGWVAIDPKGLLGDPAFDYANIFCNPDSETATAPGRLQRQAAIVADGRRGHRTGSLRG